MVLESSIPHEYYLGDLPGRLQYSKDTTEILNTDLPIDDDNCGYEFCEQSIENLNRVLPLSQSKKKWRILLMMKNAKNENGEIWIKSALLNVETGKVALLTSTNNRDNIIRRGNRPVKTVSDSWFVGHYRMSAPIIFWKELKNRIAY